jgi:hypothetical protein
VAERVFAKKLTRAGFVDLKIFGHRPLGLDESALYPLFSGDLVEAMRAVLPKERQAHVATSVVVTARKE